MDIESKAKQPDGNEDEDGNEGQQIISPESAGSKPWQTTTKLANGDALTVISKFNPETSGFHQVVDIQNDEAFTLRPLILTSGSLKGRRILVLDDIVPFRFTDLPAEIRCMIYGYLLEENEPIDIATYTPLGGHRRPCREGFWRKGAHPDCKWDDVNKKWIGQAPSNAKILSVCKQIYNETAPILYSNNIFKFYNVGVMTSFLTTIGSNRKYMKRIQISDESGWKGALNPGAFKLLTDATGLLEFRVNLRMFYPQVLGPHYLQVRHSRNASLSEFVRLLGPLLKKIRHDTKSVAKVKELVRIEWQKCRDCSFQDPRPCPKHPTCDQAGKVAKKLEIELRLRVRAVVLED